MGFRLVPKSVTVYDLERRSGRYFALFQQIHVASVALRKSSRSLSHLLMSSGNIISRPTFTLLSLPLCLECYNRPQSHSREA